MTNEAGIIIICLPFCGSRAGQVRDVSGWSLVLASGLLGSCGAQRWRCAESRVVGGDGLMTRAASPAQLLLYTRDGGQSFPGIWLLGCSCGVQGLASSVLGSCDGCSLRADVGSLALTVDGRVVLSACRQGDKSQPLCDGLGGYPEMRVRAWETTRRVRQS